MKGSGVCRGLVMGLQGVEVVEGFLPLGLGSSDVILGMQWLGSLGNMTVNWQTLTMKFKVWDTVVTSQGDSSLSKTLVSLKSILKTLKKAGEGILVELGCVQVLEEGKHTQIP